MAHKIYIGDSNNDACEVYKIFCSPDGTAHRVLKIYIGDSNNKARLCYQSLDLTNTGYFYMFATPYGTNIYEYLEEGIAADVKYTFHINTQSADTTALPQCFKYESPNGMGVMTSKYLDFDDDYNYTVTTALPVGTTRVAALTVYHSPTVSVDLFAPTDAGTIYNENGGVEYTLAAGNSVLGELTIGMAYTIQSSAKEVGLFYDNTVDVTEELFDFSSGKVTFTVKKGLERIEFYTI